MGRRSKKNYIVIVLLLLACISIGYAVLNTTLNITGKSSISKNTWNVYFENVQITTGSVETTKVPTIENSTTVDFEVGLNLPGDFYEFTVDVVNDGSIDAMIESITKEPELTSDQQKYLNYIIEYQNGEQITSKQLVKSNEFVRVKVRVEYKKDITAADLQKTNETLNLGFTLNYVQSDGTGSSVTNNGEIKKVYEIISGNLQNVGSEVAIGNEHFYIISSDEDRVTMLAKYNLEIENVCTSTMSSTCTPIENPSGIQNSKMKGYHSDGSYPIYGTTAFSANQCRHNLSSYPAYVYDSNSTLYNYIENYKTYLESQGAGIEEARLIKIEELEELGCSIDNESCIEAPCWVYETSYWTGSAHSNSTIWLVKSSGILFNNYRCNASYDYGCRPVIVIPKSEIVVNNSEI